MSTAPQTPVRHPDPGTLIVTGGSRGIGAAIARLAGQLGYAVAINYNTGETEARALVSEIVALGGRAFAIQADVAVEEQIIRMFETAERNLGPVSLWSTMRESPVG